MRAAVAVPVGPDERELERLADLVASLRAHVPDLDALVLVDDGDEKRDLGGCLDWPAERLVTLRAPRARGRTHLHDAHAAATLCFVGWLADSGLDYCVKLDTDALVIGDFRPSIEAAVEARPDVSVFGAHTLNEVGGERRDFSVFERPIRRALRPLRLRRRGLVQQAFFGPAARSRRTLRAALRSARAYGYDLGEHCAGGAYAVTAAAAACLRERGYLADPAITRGAHLAEDVVLGLLVRACGLRLGDLVAPGEAFAVRHRGLVAEPDELVRRGHALVHSLKSHPGASEEGLREEFRRLRSAATAV